jgi:omega-hydroxy-beta-dihydromenaquinone-9 sulfotransferase
MSLISRENPHDPSTNRYGDGPVNKYRFWYLRFWEGMGKTAWWSLLYRNGLAISPSRWHLALTCEILSALNSIGGGIEHVLFGHKTRKTELAQPPLFVLGHWRSGTTLLHELLIRDPEHTYPNSFECFCPVHFVFSQWWLAPITRWALPERRPMDNMPTGWERPQEDEFALCNLGLPSPYLVWAFPNHGPVFEEYLDLAAISEEHRQRWIQALQRFVQRVSYLRNLRIVLKSPPHTARVRTLLQAFPDARFVHIVRDPLIVFPSTVRLWRALSEAQGLQVVDPLKLDAWLEDAVLRTLVRMYEAFERDRELIPPSRLVEIRYEDLIEDPKRELRTVYEQLELGPFSRVEPGIDEYLLETKDYQRNRFELPPEIERRVREQWSPYFEKYGYGCEVATSEKCAG